MGMGIITKPREPMMVIRGKQRSVITYTVVTEPYEAVGEIGSMEGAGIAEGAYKGAVVRKINEIERPSGSHSVLCRHDILGRCNGYGCVHGKGRGLKFQVSGTGKGTD